MTTILEFIKPNIALLTINRPDALNAINNEVMQGIFDTCTALKENKNLRGIIITGAGEKAFVAGADITGFLQLSADDARKLTRLGHDTYHMLEHFPVPVIAAVNGFALGGGCELAMACHLRIAVNAARFGQPEVNLGLIPGYGGTQRLPRLVGKGRALQMILTGDMIDAPTALSWGLVNALAENKEELIATCVQWIEKIASKGPSAIETAISLVNANDDGLDGFAMEIDAFSELLLSAEAEEGVKAFLEKRKANFRS